MRLAIWIASLLAVTVLVAAPLAWFGYRLYVERIVGQSPATMPVLATERGPVQLGRYDRGDQVFPTATALPTIAVVPTAAATAAPGAAAAVRQPSPRPVLPPTGLRIPRIGVNAPVVLADNDDLPRFKAVGWYIGTGYPGFRGNVVLFGHLNGPYETFGRLHELKIGDQVIIQAMSRSYEYQVNGRQVVPSTMVEVMAPTDDARLTLITCTGTFFPLTRDYSDRLIVTALLRTP